MNISEANKIKKTLVIILNFNKPNETMSCVESIFEMAGAYDMMVIDNGSSKKIKNELIKSLREKHYLIELTGDSCGEDYKKYSMSPDKNVFFMSLEKNTGYAKGNNYGLRFSFTSGYEYSLVSNNDVLIQDQYVLDKLTSAMNANREVAWCAPMVITKSGSQEGPFPEPELSELVFKKGILLPLWLVLIRERENKKYAILKERYNNLTLDPYIFVGSFSMLRNSAVNDIGYFDEKTFLYSEEQILSEKLRKKGYKLKFVPEVSVIHNHDYDNDGINYRLELIFLSSRIYYYIRYRKKNKIVVMIAALSRIAWLLIYKPAIVAAKRARRIIKYTKRS